MSDHFLSIIVPVYNAEKYIGKTVESVLNQTYSDLELILVENGSTDNTPQILEGFTDERIKVISLSDISNAAQARNAGVEAASGRYIAYVDADDLWMADKLEKQLKFMRDFETDAIVATPSYCMYLAEAAHSMADKFPMESYKLKYGILGSEGSTPEMRAEIEKHWGNGFFCTDNYGMSVRTERLPFDQRHLVFLQQRHDVLELALVGARHVLGTNHRAVIGTKGVNYLFVPLGIGIAMIGNYIAECKLHSIKHTGIGPHAH